MTVLMINGSPHSKGGTSYALSLIKQRKGERRTYFLDKLRGHLNLRMQRDDEKERERRR